MAWMDGLRCGPDLAEAEQNMVYESQRPDKSVARKRCYFSPKFPPTLAFFRIGYKPMPSLEKGAQSTLP